MRLLALVLGLGIGFLGYLGLAPAEAVNPADARQQNADIYSCCGYPTVFSGTTPGDLSTFNPLTQSLRAGSRTIRYRYQVVAGCSDGNMKTTLRTALDSTTQVTGITFIEDNAGYQFTVRANCGTAFVNICGASAIACLGRGFPGLNDVDASTMMATFYDLSQVSIWLHEIAGHGLGTWHEQYKLDGTFAATPGLVDFMNTGPDSRYNWPQNDRDRWERTVYSLQAPPCGDPCWSDGPGGFRWRFSDGRSFAPDSGCGSWYSAKNTLEWGACTVWPNGERGRWHGPSQTWLGEFGSEFSPALNEWFRVNPIP